PERRDDATREATLVEDDVERRRPLVEAGLAAHELRHEMAPDVTRARRAPLRAAERIEALRMLEPGAVAVTRARLEQRHELLLPEAALGGGARARLAHQAPQGADHRGGDGDVRARALLQVEQADLDRHALEAGDAAARV